MLKPLNQEDFKMRIIEDLGVINGTRKAIFQCSKCLKPFQASVRAAKYRQQKQCLSCRNTLSSFTKEQATIIKRLNSHCRYNARKRNMQLPFWSSSAELGQWLKTQPRWPILWEAYEQSGYDPNLAPSIDRLDNSKSYTEENIELVTWEENNRRGHEYTKECLNKYGAVSVYYTTGEYIDTFVSISDAENQLQCPNLLKVLKQERKQACNMIAVAEPEELSIFDKIRRWASTRNLISEDGVDGQILKLIEEFGELAQGLQKESEDEIRNAIGDIGIVLTILAADLGIKIEEVLYSCQEEIGLRQGKLINGIFVKEE